MRAAYQKRTATSVSSLPINSGKQLSKGVADRQTDSIKSKV